MAGSADLTRRGNGLVICGYLFWLAAACLFGWHGAVHSRAEGTWAASSAPDSIKFLMEVETDHLAAVLCQVCLAVSGTVFFAAGRVCQMLNK